MNYMKQVAEMLGVEIGERFNITNKIDGHIMRDDYYLSHEGLMREGFTSSHRKVLADLLAGKIKIVKKPWKPIFDERYWFVCCDGKIASDINTQNTCDYEHMIIGNCFCTPADAEAHKDEVMAKFKAVMK